MKLSLKAQRALAPELVKAAIRQFKDDPEVAGEVFAGGERAGVREHLIESAMNQLDSLEPPSKSVLRPWVVQQLDALTRYAEKKAYDGGYMSDEEQEAHYLEELDRR